MKPKSGEMHFLLQRSPHAKGEHLRLDMAHFRGRLPAVKKL